ncbi:hypothetical protein ACFY1P_34040 [Streptomyces sp. NPDC001407]|uniref:hypothetical protein n=1 Tax=Streptomyces sp. NPDC001407 TaxID=3364573 RepID=UPI0036C5EDC0
MLADGTAHAAGAPSGGGLWNSVHAAWRPAQIEAQRLGRPVRVSVGHLDGTVAAYLAHPNGQVDWAYAHPQPPMPEHLDSRWLDGTLEQHPLVETVRAAQRATDWRAAQAAAGRLAAQVRAELGGDHPHTVLATELEGFFALHARDWPAAARLHLAVAEDRHRLAAPPGDTQRVLHNAVAAWCHARSDPEAAALGFALAHLLVRIAPHDSRALSAVLRNLPSTVTT